MKEIGIFGSSGYAREVRDIASDLGYRAVFIVRDQSEVDEYISPGDVILERDVGRYGDMQFAIGIGDNMLRQKLALRYCDELEFINLIHPSASFGIGQREAIAASRGVIVCAGVRFTNNIRVGDFTIFNLNATIGHDSIIDDFANVAPGANISGNVHLGARCWVGTGAAVNQGTGAMKLVIGAGAIVGSGAVVVRHCEPNAVYAGVPAKKIK